MNEVGSLSKRPRLGSLLVVDDSTAARRQIRQAFEQAGFEVNEASEGVEAMWRARERQYDAVITDVYMPTMDGLEFLRELRKVPGYAEAPVYVVTSDCSHERMKVGRDLGVTGWVVKPVVLSGLVEAVRELLVGKPPALAVR